MAKYYSIQLEINGVYDTPIAIVRFWRGQESVLIQSSDYPAIVAESFECLRKERQYPTLTAEFIESIFKEGFPAIEASLKKKHGVE